MENSDLTKSLGRFQFDLFLAQVELGLVIFSFTSTFEKVRYIATFHLPTFSLLFSFYNSIYYATRNSVSKWVY